MILFTRAVARDFRVLFARCAAGRPRGPAPPVVIQIKSGIRTMTATTPEGVTLTHTGSAPTEGEDLVVLPATILAAMASGTDEPVALDHGPKLRGTLRWSDGSEPRTQIVELVLPGKPHHPPAPPALSDAPTELLAALHECGRTAAKVSGRYALSRVQLRGRTGRVIGTDGRTALVWAGLPFPFADDALVPAVPVFGAKLLSRVPHVGLGRAEAHVVVTAGPWTVWLPTDTGAKYPDVAGVIPRRAPTAVAIDPADAAALLPALPGLPGRDHEHRPVTLDVGPTVRVRAGGTHESEVQEMPLARTSASGPAACVALDRRVLARALGLGCYALELAPDKPVVFTGGRVTFVAVPLDPTLCAPGGVQEPGPVPPTTDPERNPTVKPESTGPAVPQGDPPDPLDLAEELRAALSGAASAAARLVAVLRQGKREKKVLSALMTNLKQLNLGGPS